MIYLEIFAILIVLIAMTWVKHNGFRIGMAKAREKDEENRKKRKAITKNMNFFETYNYLLQKKNGKDLKLQNQTRTTLYIAFFLSIIMVVGYSIAHKSFNIFFAIIAVIGITLVLTAVVMIWLVLVNIDIDSDIEEKDLKNKFYKEICETLLKEHGYTDVYTDQLSIPDMRVGLMSGDQKKELISGITCKEFSYNKIKYYHEVVNTDSNGKETRHDETSFIGFEVFIPYNTGINETVRIIPSIMKAGQERIYNVISRGKLEGEEHIDIEDIEFNEKFEVYSKDAHSAYYFLNAERIEYLKQLRRNSLISVVINKDGLYVATNRVNLLLDVPPVESNQEISKERFEKDFNEFEKLIGEYKKIVE